MNHNRLRIDTSITNGQPSSTIPSPRRYRGRSPLPGPRPASFATASSSRGAPNTASGSPGTPSAQPSSSRIPARTDRSTSRTRTKPTSPVGSVFDESMQVGADYVLAMHDYTPDQQNATCLAFKAGQVIRVHNKHASGWWDGEIDDRRGWFPSNYVQAEIESLTAEELPRRQTKKGHVQSQSVASTTSWTSSTSIPADTRTRPRSKTPEAYGTETDSYCPALMVPLLHGLSLLQNAVRSNRATHFAPSTACIISCVRAILSATETLQRDAPILQRYPSLGYERRQILSVLAALVAQAKKAADPRLGDDQREGEVESMLRLGGQVFAHVRRFLTVAVQCGVELPNQRNSTSSFGSTATEGSAGSLSQTEENLVQPDSVETAAVADTPTQMRPRGRDMVVGSTKGPRARSLTDIKRRKAAAAFNENETMHLQPRFVQSHGISRKGASSISSSSASISSISSEDGHPPAPPAFPSGLCTGAQVMEALRSTHDQYLSTIAAFIGHAHSHSRTSHASSTGHLYDLVREIVEMVCKLLTIVEAVINHPDVPSQRLGNLRTAKDGLYSVTSSLAESVRLLTVPLPASLTEEEEKQSLLRSATNALKAGADCVASVKVCLNRSTGDHPFYLELPNITENGEEPFSPTKFSNLQLMKSWSLDALKDRAQIQDSSNSSHHPDLVPVRKIQDDSSGSGSDHSITSKTSIRTDSTAPTSIDEVIHRPAPLNLGHHHQHSPVSPGLGSPQSFDQGDEDVTWEADKTNENALEESLLSGEPPVTAAVTELQDINVWASSHDYALEDAAFGADGKLVGATMEAIVEKLTPHNSVADAEFVAIFFMTFRLFSSPQELVRVLIQRFNVLPPAGCSPEDHELWQQRKGIPVRLRVSNFIKTWVENYWLPPNDDVVAEYLAGFVREGLARTFSGPAKRIQEFLSFRRQAQEQHFSPKGERLRDGAFPRAPPAIFLSSEAPRPTISRALLSTLRKRDHSSVLVTDFDALELARQLSVMESGLYGAITPEEILETGNKNAKPPLNVRAVSSLSTAITGWVAESILNESDLKKRTSLVRFFIKVADRCLSLNNFSTCRAMLAALDSSTISRLHQTWTGIPQKSKTQLDALRRIADYSRNFLEYRTRLKNTPAPAVPFLGLYLTDVIFCKEGNPSYRPSPLNSSKKLINWNKYHKLAAIVHDMQRFQVPYNLKAVPEIQDYLNEAFEKARHHGDLQDLYRRSLLIEPKQAADAPPTVNAPPTSDVRQLFNWATRSQGLPA